MAEGYEQRDSEDRLYRMRHSAAHVLAQAVLEQFPDMKWTIGPPIDTGFYYDFDLPRPISDDDLPKIEERMREVVAADVAFRESHVSKDEARRIFADNPYKLELIDGFEGDTVGLCQHDTFLDLCQGRHVERSGQIGAFKLMNIAGAYWRGDERNKMLTRVYGALYATQAELDAHLEALEEARRRDHRRLGKDLEIFAFSEDVGPGIALLYPKGEVIKHVWEQFVRDLRTKHGYQHVWTGNVVREELYRKSGHLEAGYDMFPPMIDPDHEDAVFRLKPMNCPSHMALFKTKLHSYRELPVRYAEYAALYRYEKSGQLNGLTRVRAFTQDDCHIFCMPEQIESEFALCLQLIRETLEVYGITDYRVRLSLRGEDDGEKYVGSVDQWTRATAALRSAMAASGIEYFTALGEAAIYGPKADFIAKDVLGRDWQISTIQVDFVQPARIGCEYVAEDGTRKVPAVLHTAVTGSFERFLGLLIEHYNGAFPVWLSPVQAVVIPIADRHAEYAEKVADRLRAAALRVNVDIRPERMNAKIRDAQLQKIPYMLVVGDREAEAGAVNVRLRNNETLGAVSLEDLRNRMLDEVAEKR